ncbi:MAG: peptide chain release factor 3 [Gemmataceae bacterium]
MNIPVTSPEANPLRDQIQRRRTFAIISHPDAGKTTLTEKFLLYAGCIDIAGAVRGRKTQRAVASDWMELERERGISITSTVLSFPYQGFVINLLDTPGHQDFCEDTYRTLAAADSAVMVVDAAKGIEQQTKKLFQVCAARQIPIMTFINKMDRHGREPLDLLGEIEQVLGIAAVPLNWPIGLGPEFRGIVDRPSGDCLLFHPTHRGTLQVPTTVVPLRDVDRFLSTSLASRCREELELLDGAGEQFDSEQFLRGQVTPVFFGSAMTNFGVEPFLHAFVRLAPPPGARGSDQGLIPPDHPEFAGVVFKIQANLNPKHRDRIAFIRVCRGRFASDTEPSVARTGERVRIKGSHRMFARDRDAIAEAYAGDIIGLAIAGGLRLGDTIHEGTPIHYEGLPQFSPECFAVARCQDTTRRKQMVEGLNQLADEGAIQLFFDPADSRELILAAVGELQFEVVRFRLEAEYGAKVEIKTLSYRTAAWIDGGHQARAALQTFRGTRRVLDHRNREAVLADDPWHIRYLQKQNPTLAFRLFSEQFFVPSA